MFRNSAIRAFALIIGSATVYSGAQLSASVSRSEPVTIPFDFKVEKTTMPAGEYRVERETGSEITRLVNVRTRRSVQMLRSNANGFDGKVGLTFTRDGSSYRVKVR